jgi:hypothetical protein
LSKAADARRERLSRLSYYNFLPPPAAPAQRLEELIVDVVEDRIAEEPQKKNRSKKWERFRKGVIKERGCKCQVCGLSKEEKVDIRLGVHHIQKWNEYPQFRYLKSNVVVCCQFCHPLLENLSYGKQILCIQKESLQY